MEISETTVWIGFSLFVAIMLSLDLFVFNRKVHTIKLKEALLWTGFWVLLAAGMGLFIYAWRGGEAAKMFATGYLVELSLSVDNLFVFLLLFTYFRTPQIYQHKVLFWGIIGALFFRILFIFLGIQLIERFNFTLYILGGFLIYTSIKMVFGKENDVHPDQNIATRLFRKVMPVSREYVGDKFFARLNGVRHATPLFIVLIVVETTDIVFALDSIPAILGITQDSFLVFSSNIFAILGLRSLYFALSGIMELFHYLKYGLAAILFFIGVKIVLQQAVYHIPVDVSLIVVGGVLLLSILASLVFPSKGDNVPKHATADEGLIKHKKD